MRTVGPGEGRAGLIIRAGKQRNDVEGIPNARGVGTYGEKRQGVHGLRGDGVAHLAAFGLQERRDVLDGHGFRGASDFERGIGADGLRGLNNEARTDELLESGGGDGELVSARRKLRDCVVAGAGGGHRVYGGGFGVPRFDGGGGNYGAGRVGHGAGNCSAITLTYQGYRTNEEQSSSNVDAHFILSVPDWFAGEPKTPYFKPLAPTEILTRDRHDTPVKTRMQCVTGSEL